MPSWSRLGTFLSHVSRGEDVRAVNPTVTRASTYVFKTVDDYLNRWNSDVRNPIGYGTGGSPTTIAFTETISKLEHGFNTVAFPSGLSAITISLMSFVQSGDHILMTDAVYGPARKWALETLGRMGVETTFYDPLISPAELQRLCKPKQTKVLYVEAPSSLTFEVPNLPELSKAAKAACGPDVKVLVDNTWATPLLFKPLTKGADVSICAATKYLCGHSDTLLGTATAKDEKTFQLLRNQLLQLGVVITSDVAWSGLRDLRTAHVRIKHMQESSLVIAKWLQNRPEVLRVLHPALSSCPGHENWARDFDGATSAFGFLLKQEYSNPERVKDMFNHLEVFSIGASFGGFASLMVPSVYFRSLEGHRWEAFRDCQLIRAHVGLEDVQDLQEDLQQAFTCLKEEQGRAKSLTSSHL